MLGLVAALVASQVFGGDDASDTVADVPTRTVDGEVDSPEDLLPDDFPVPPGAGAESAEAALTGFLDAEVAQDFEESFGYLSAADRVEFVSPAEWVASHADQLPPILDYEVGDTESGGDGREIITTDVSFEAGLDPVIGLTPAEATVRWDVVQDDEGAWGVALESSAVEPQYPSDDGVVPAAEAWAEARQDCETPANERGGLVGSPSLAKQLCDTSGAVEISEPETLDDAEAQPIFTAFGPEAVGAARVVRLSGPAKFGLVLVPIGDDWTVVAVLP